MQIWTLIWIQISKEFQPNACQLFNVMDLWVHVDLMHIVYLRLYGYKPALHTASMGLNCSQHSAFFCCSCALYGQQVICIIFDSTVVSFDVNLHFYKCHLIHWNTFLAGKGENKEKTTTCDVARVILWALQFFYYLFLYLQFVFMSSCENWLGGCLHVQRVQKLQTAVFDTVSFRW